MTFRAIAAVAVSLTAFTLANAASAADLTTPIGGKGQIVLDQLGGFRAGSAAGPTGNFSYSGFIGFSYSRYNANTFDVNGMGGNGGSTAYNYTSFWLEPAADYFVVNHLSIGGLVELGVTSTSRDDKANAQAEVKTTSLPTTLNFTIYPRIGYLIPIGNRFGIWPRVGAGFGMRQFTDNNNNKQTFSGFVVDVDVGFILRINETFFLRLAPEFSAMPGSQSFNNGNNTVSVSASEIQFAITGGIGVIL